MIFSSLHVLDWLLLHMIQLDTNESVSDISFPINNVSNSACVIWGLFLLSMVTVIFVVGEPMLEMSVLIPNC